MVQVILRDGYVEGTDVDCGLEGGAHDEFLSGLAGDEGGSSLQEVAGWLPRRMGRGSDGLDPSGCEVRGIRSPDPWVWTGPRSDLLHGAAQDVLS
jgi:hypothetical protein